MISKSQAISLFRSVSTDSIASISAYTESRSKAASGTAPSFVMFDNIDGAVFVGEIIITIINTTADTVVNSIGTLSFYNSNIPNTESQTVEVKGSLNDIQLTFKGVFAAMNINGGGVTSKNHVLISANGYIVKSS